MKDLIRISKLDDDICKVEVDIQNDNDGELLAANLLGILAEGNPRVVAAVLSATYTFLNESKDELNELVRSSIQRISPNQTIS